MNAYYFFKDVEAVLASSVSTPLPLCLWIVRHILMRALLPSKSRHFLGFSLSESKIFNAATLSLGSELRSSSPIHENPSHERLIQKAHFQKFHFQGAQN